jgi:hypothetical protein
MRVTAFQTARLASTRNSITPNCGLAKDYVNGRIQIVLRGHTSGQAHDWNLVIARREFGPPLNNGRLGPGILRADVDLAGQVHAIDRAIGHEQAPVVFDVPKLVETPEGFVPSRIWLEPAKDRLDVRRNVAATTFNLTVQFGGAISESEGRLGRVGPRSEGDGCDIDGMVERRAKFGGDVEDTDLNLARHDSREVQPMDLISGVRVCLWDDFSGVVTEDPEKSLGNFVDVFVCARDEAHRAAKTCCDVQAAS